MATLALYAVLAIVLIGIVFVLITRVLPAGEQVAPPVRDDPVWALPPDRPLVAEDVATVRLPVAIRGYRFAETDDLLDRLADELRRRDEQIAQLQGMAAPAHPVPFQRPPAQWPAGTDSTDPDERDG